MIRNKHQLSTNAISHFMGLIAIIVLLESCQLFYPPATSVEANVRIKDSNSIELYGYYERMRNDPYFMRQHYFLTGVEIEEDRCVAGRCGKRVWEIENTKVFEKSFDHTHYVLPKEVVYGVLIPGYEELIPAENLEFGVPYTARIGILGREGDTLNDIYFSAEARFILTKGDDSKINVIQID